MCNFNTWIVDRIWDFGLWIHRTVVSSVTDPYSFDTDPDPAF